MIYNKITSIKYNSYEYKYPDVLFIVWTKDPTPKELSMSRSIKLKPVKIYTL